MTQSTIGREHARRIVDTGLAAVNPERLVADFVNRTTALRAELQSANRVIVVGGGKAGAGMVAGIERSCISLQSLTGVVNVPDALMGPTRSIRLSAARPAGCNEPTEAAAAAAEQMLRLVAGAEHGDLVLVLISGGGSALLPAPVAGVSLADTIALTRALSACGADIVEFNCVRKHLSRIKGGRLAAAASPAAAWALLISDVPGDPLDVIASGPTVPDPTTFSDAWTVIERYNLIDQLPASVTQYLNRGRRGLEPETPKSLNDNIRNVLLAGGGTALQAAAVEAGRLGYRVVSLGDKVVGNVGDVARSVAATVRAAVAPTCLLLGGEVTVSLPADHGKGGRNQEFALAMACQLGADGLRGVTVLSVGTDGEDGPTDAAGAFVDRELLASATAKCLDPRIFLTRHDAYRFFQPLGGLLTTGLTGTNVADLRVVLIGTPPR